MKTRLSQWKHNSEVTDGRGELPKADVCLTQSGYGIAGEAVCWAPATHGSSGDTYYNSYVILAEPVSHEDHRWLWFHPDSGQSVSLRCINGHGEIRWTVDHGMVHDECARFAVAHFGLE